MAVVSVHLYPLARDQGIHTLDLKSRDQTQQTLQTYRVVCGSLSDDADVVRASGDLPQLGDVDAKGRVCTRVQPERTIESALVWDVQVEFSIQTAQGNPGEATKWNFDVSATGIKTTQTAYKDNTNPDPIPYENSAGDPYDPRPVDTLYDEETTFSFETATLNRDTYKACRGHSNDAEVSFTVKGETFTYPANTLLIDNITYSASINLASGSEVVAWKVAYVCIERVDTWVTHYLDQGLNIKDSGDLKAITDALGQPVQTQRKLDGGGILLTDGGTPVFNPYQSVPQADFSGLFEGFPT